MNHNLEVATVKFTLDEIIINFGTPFQEEMGFWSLPSSPELLQGYGEKCGRNLKLLAHLLVLVLPWLKMRRTLTLLPVTSLFLDV